MSGIYFEKERGNFLKTNKELENKLRDHEKEMEEKHKSKKRKRPQLSLTTDRQWMLPHLNEKLTEDKARKASQNKNQSKKKKKKLNSSESDSEKRRKDKKSRRRRSSSSSTGDSSEHWIEKAPYEGKPLERDGWMSIQALVPTFDVKKKKKVMKDDNKCIIAAPGQSDRELNPYWKDGGSGLPAVVPDLNLTSSNIGDKGLEWYERALKRAKETAENEGRSVADVVSERWGSLDTLTSLISQAKSHGRCSRGHDDDKRRRPAFRKPGEEYGRTSSEKYDDRKKKWMKDSHKADQPRNRANSEDRSSSSSKGRQRDKFSSSEDESKFARKVPITHGTERSSTSTIIQANRVPNSKDGKQVLETETKVLTDEQLNSLAAKLVKAEIMGNADQVEKLKKKLADAREARAKAIELAGAESSKAKETIVLMETNRKGLTRPIQRPNHPEPFGGRRKQRKVETHSSGQRMRYFADDDQRDIRQMFEQEKLNSGEDDQALFIKMAVRRAGAGSDEEDAAFADTARMVEATGKVQQREMGRAVRENQRRHKTLDGCSWCLDSPQRAKHLLVSIGETCYLCLPAEESLTPLHCLLVPVQHVTSGTQLDEDVWEEMHRFRRAVVSMATALGQDVVFFEQARMLKNHPHMVLHCVVLDKEVGDMAPIYFKKALLECENEWANNKKVVDVKGPDVRGTVPKGLPYFAVEFPPQGGFAHVIEDEKNFPANFAPSVIGGMLDLDHRKWRKPQKSSLVAQREKTVAFSRKFSKYDFTVKTKRKSKSSSSSSSSESSSCASDSD